MIPGTKLLYDYTGKEERRRTNTVKWDEKKTTKSNNKKTFE